MQAPDPTARSLPETPAALKWTALAVLLLAALLRIYCINCWSLNNDEIAEARWSSYPFSVMMWEVRFDKVHPPFDYFIQFAVGRIDGPEWIRRTPSLLFGVGTVAAVLLLGTLWSSPAAGVIAGLLMAVAPMHVRFSQEIRPYSSALFFLCAALAALELYARTRRRAWAITWFVLVFLAGATLYFAGMVVAIATLFRIFIDRHDRLRVLWRRLPLIILAWAILYSPWFSVIMDAARAKPPQQPDPLDWPFWKFRLQTFATGDWRYETVSLGSWAFWAAVAGGIALSVRSRLVRVAAVWFVIGTMAEIVALHLRPHYTSPRYLMPTWPAAFILAGTAIVWLSRRAWSVPLAAAIVFVFVSLAAVTLSEYYRGGRSDWRGIAEYVYQRVRPGETIILTNSWTERNFPWYWSQFPRRTDVALQPFDRSNSDFVGPAWIVTGHCLPREPLKPIGIMRQFPMSELAEVRYVRPGQILSMREELCPD